MPLPKPEKGEEHDEFVSRCMGDETMVTDFPDEKQRYAVCESQSKKREESDVSYYEIRAKAESAEVWLYDQIGEDIFGEGTTAKTFVAELSKLKTGQIDLHVNSAGGSVFDGMAIANAIARHPAKVTAYVDGVAASIAGVIALAGDKVVMARNALFMVHDPWGMAMGTSNDIRAYADVLDKVASTIKGVYRDKTALPDETLSELMAAETWMTAAEAHAYGFADEIAPALDMAACADFSPFNYKHPPVNESVATEPETVEIDDAGEPDAEAEDSGEPANSSDMDLLGYAIGLSPTE